MFELGVKIEIHSEEDIDNSTRIDSYPEANDWYFYPDQNGTVRVLVTAQDEEEKCVAEYSISQVIRAYLYEEETDKEKNLPPKPERVNPIVNELYEEEDK